MNLYHRPRLNGIEEPMALLIKTLMEVIIPPQERRSLGLGRYLIQHPLINDHNPTSHLLIQILPLLFVLEIWYELLDGFHHLSFGEVILGKDGFKLLKEAIHFIV